MAIFSIWFFLTMSMDCFSICLCPLLFRWAVVCSSPWRGPLTFLVSCIPRYLIFFVAIVNGSLFLICLSLVFYWHIGMLVIFAHWFCILRLCWSSLSVSGDFGLRWWGLLNIQSCLQIETIWLPHFLFEYPLFLFLAWLLWLEHPALYWIGVVKEGILV